jgi:hypothetical protein
MIVNKVRISYDGTIEYFLSSEDGHNNTVVSEGLIRGSRKNNIADGRFKIGDTISYRGIHNSNQKSVVSEAYTYLMMKQRLIIN